MGEWLLFTSLGFAGLILAIGWPVWALVLVTGLQLMPNLGIVDKLTEFHLVAGYGAVVALRLFIKPPPGKVVSSHLRLVVVFLVAVMMLSVVWSREGIWALDGFAKYTRGIGFAWLLSLFIRERRELIALLYLMVVIAVAGTFLTIHGVVFLGLREGGSGLNSNPNGNAFYFILVMPLAYCLMRSVDRVWLRRILIVVPPLLTIGIVATGSRSAMLAAAVLWMLLLFKDRTSPALYATIALGAMGAVVAMPYLQENVERLTNLRQLTQKNVEEGSLAGRKALAVNGTRAFLERPLLGYGVRNGRLRVAELMYKQKKGSVTAAWLKTHTPGGRGDLHNTYLTLAVDTGAVGLTLFLAAAWIAMRDLRRVRERHVRISPDLTGLVRYLPAGFAALLFLLLFMNQLDSPLLWFVLFLPVIIASAIANAPPEQATDSAGESPV